jgi:hypothetical protein
MFISWCSETESIALANTTTILQLAFGLNGVIAVLINEYSRKSEHITALFIDKLRLHKPNFSIGERQERFEEYLFGSMPGYRFVRRLFVLSISLSIISIIFSFYYLIQAAINPKETISCEILSCEIFVVCATMMVIVNPAIFAMFRFVSDMQIWGVEYKISVSSTIVGLLEGYLEWPEQKKQIDAIVSQARMAI